VPSPLLTKRWLAVRATQWKGDISETELDTKFAEPGPYLERLVAGARSAIAAGAQVVIPAEGVLGMMAAQNGLHDVDGVPLIDTIGTPILFAEFMMALKRQTGVAQSRSAYPLRVRRPGNLFSTPRDRPSPEPHCRVRNAKIYRVARRHGEKLNG
jgi:hypothetical protein